MGGSKGGNMIGKAGQHGSFGRDGMAGQGGTRPEAPAGTENGALPGDKRGNQSGKNAVTP